MLAVVCMFNRPINKYSFATSRSWSLANSTVFILSLVETCVNNFVSFALYLHGRIFTKCHFNYDKVRYCTDRSDT